MEDNSTLASERYIRKKKLISNSDVKYVIRRLQLLKLGTGLSNRKFG